VQGQQQPADQLLVKARDQVAVLREAVEQRQVVMVVQGQQQPADQLLVKARDQVAVLREAVEQHLLNRRDILTTVDKQAYMHIHSHIFTGRILSL
jgi:hypothetical protein